MFWAGVGISEIVQDGNAYELNKPLGRFWDSQGLEL